MRKPNYKAGWYVHEKIMAPTHFHSEITQDDRMAVNRKRIELEEGLEQRFHLILDNRAVQMNGLYKLEQFATLLTNPLLRWIIVVVPRVLEINPADIVVEEQDGLGLKNVASIAEAVAFLKLNDDSINWLGVDSAFFPDMAEPA